MRRGALDVVIRAGLSLSEVIPLERIGLNGFGFQALWPGAVSVISAMVSPDGATWFNLTYLGAEVTVTATAGCAEPSFPTDMMWSQMRIRLGTAASPSTHTSDLTVTLAVSYEPTGG